MSSATILDFYFDAENEDKLADHALTPRRVLQILDGKIVKAKNRKGGRGDYLVIGRDHGGTAISVPVEATHDPIVWRPITAWPSKAHEEAKL